jgi:hypothetical protein
MGQDSSVTTWIGLLRAGEEEAAQRLWERKFRPQPGNFFPCRALVKPPRNRG